MSTISKLKIALGQSPAQQSQFRVIVNPPAILGISLSEVDRLSILAKSVSDPESTIGTITMNVNGFPLTFKGDRSIEPITISYRIDANLRVHSLLQNWMDFLVATDGSTAARSHSDYVGSMIIEKLRLNQRGGSEDPEVVARCFVKDCFITSMPSMGLDQDSVNEAITIDTTWYYTSFKWEYL